MIYMCLTYKSFGYVIPSTILSDWSPKPYWLVGRIELARAWSRRLTNHGLCYFLLDLVYSSITPCVSCLAYRPGKGDDRWMEIGMKW